MPPEITRKPEKKLFEKITDSAWRAFCLLIFYQPFNAYLMHNYITPKVVKETASGIVEFIKIRKTPQLVLFGEIHNKDVDLTISETIPELYKLGYRAIFFEEDYRNQDAINDYLAGKINFEELVPKLTLEFEIVTNDASENYKRKIPARTETITSYRKTMELAKNLGIQVLAIDYQPQLTVQNHANDKYNFGQLATIGVSQSRDAIMYNNFITYFNDPKNSKNKAILIFGSGHASTDYSYVIDRDGQDLRNGLVGTNLGTLLKSNKRFKNNMLSIQLAPDVRIGSVAGLNNYNFVSFHDQKLATYEKGFDATFQAPQDLLLLLPDLISALTPPNTPRSELIKHTTNPLYPDFDPESK